MLNFQSIQNSRFSAWAVDVEFLRMKTVFILILGCVLGVHVYAQPETNLIQEIKDWRKGDAPPARLIKFPDGKIDALPECGLWEASAGAGYYIREIQDADLLAALMFDRRAETETFKAAASRLISLNGVDHVSRLLSERRKTDPEAFRRPELAVLSQLVRSPYIAVQVARISHEDIPAEKAEKALTAMRQDLRNGAAWRDALRKQADLHPDIRDRANNPKSVGTLISYLYDSVVSQDGFDIVYYRILERVPPGHLRELFRAKQGTHVLKGEDGVYLYHIRKFYPAD
jgi:hypothetical protein